jgi:hypothetical protein
LSRISCHLDWYLRKAYEKSTVDKLSITEIQHHLKALTNVKFRESTILKYNSSLFSSYQTAPLEWIGGHIYRLNDNYYKLLKDKIFEPRIEIRGPPKKYTKGESQLDYQI